MTRRATCLAGVAMLAGLLCLMAQAAPPPGVVIYEAHLQCKDLITGERGVTSMSEVNARAAAWVQAYVDGDELVINGTYSGLSSPVMSDLASGVHIHHDPAAYHVDTLIRGLSNEGGTAGMFRGRVSLTPDYRAMLELGRMYVDIHTAAFPEGEVRGMLVPVSASGGAVW